MPRAAARGGSMKMPARGWGEFVDDLKNFDFNRAKKWFGLAAGGQVKADIAKMKKEMAAVKKAVKARARGGK